MATQTLQILNMLGLILVLVLNTLANTLPINGISTGAISARYPNLFVPAGFTFSIWGVIYLSLLAFIIYQIRSWWNRDTSVEVVQTISIWFFISCLANVSWILAWHYQQVELSVVIMLILLSCLIIIYRKLQIGRLTVSSARKFFVHLPFSIYLGWITVATIANITALLVHWNLSGFWLGEITWTMLMILTATIIGVLFLQKKQDFPYALVLIWAFYGIAAARSERTILWTAYLGMAILSILAIFIFPRWVKHKI